MSVVAISCDMPDIFDAKLKLAALRPSAATDAKRYARSESLALTQSACGFVMPSQNINVFVFYSHADAALVAPVVKLLRVNKSLVFQDTDGIQPGKRWRDEIAKALAESDLVVVFWCDHACRSTEVSTEWKGAIEQEKDVLPLLLDTTPLPLELGQFQWIDFRGTVGANHSSIELPEEVVWQGPESSSAPSPGSMRGLSLRAVWSALAGVAVVVARVFSVVQDLPIKSGEGGAPYRQEAPEFVSISWILVLLGVVVAVGAYLLWLRERRTSAEERIEIARPHPGEIEQRIAVELEAEILRRTASAQDGGHNNRSQRTALRAAPEPAR